MNFIVAVWCSFLPFGSMVMLRWWEGPPFLFWLWMVCFLFRVGGSLFSDAALEDSWKQSDQFQFEMMEICLMSPVIHVKKLDPP